MTNEEITECEHRPDVIDVLTSKEMGAWLHRRDERIKELEQRTGHWILDETDNSITCDKCGCLIWANDISNGDAHYCPNCGAKIVEPQESEDMKQEPMYCDRNICLKNEYNGIGCAECEVTKSREQGPVFYPQVEGITPTVVRQEPCEDAISRQEAIDTMYELCDTGETLIENPWRDNPHIDAITDALENLPSVKPKQTEITLESAIDYLHSIGWMQKHDKEMTECAERAGHWIECEDEVKCFCSECKEISDYPTKFCPNCGAKMESEEQE